MLGRLMNQARENTDYQPSKETTKKSIIENAANFLYIEGYVLIEDVKIPVNQGGQIAFNKSVSISPPLLTLEPEKTFSLIKPASITFFEDMTESDRRSYEEAVEGGYRNAVQMRAQRAGLVSPNGH
jgi:hypothetical protein